MVVDVAAVRHVAKARMALDASMPVKEVVDAWYAEGRPGGADELRARLEKVADVGPVAEAVTDLRAAGAAGVKK